MLALSLFGTVTGLEVRTFGQMPTPLPDEWIALSSGDLRLHEGATVLGINRRSTDAGVLTWIGLYRTAMEMTTDRAGGCIGAGVWVLNKAVPSGPVLELLDSLTQQLTELALSGGRFTRRISAVENMIDWRDDIGKKMRLLADLPRRGGLGAGDLPKAFFDASEKGNSVPLDWMVEVAQKGPGLDGFRTLFMSTNEAIADSARRGGRLQILTLDGLLTAQMLEDQRSDEEVSAARVRLKELERSLNDESAARRAADELTLTLRSANVLALRERDEADEKQRIQAQDLQLLRTNIESVRSRSEYIERDVQRREQELSLASGQFEKQKEQTLAKFRRQEEELTGSASRAGALEKRLERRNREIEDRESSLKKIEREHADRERDRIKQKRESEESIHSLKTQLNELQYQRDLERHQLQHAEAQLKLARDRPGVASTAMIPRHDFIFQDNNRQSKKSKRVPGLMMSAALILLLACTSAAIWMPFRTPTEAQSEAHPQGTNCHTGWHNLEIAQVATRNILNSDSATTRLTAQALWGVACGARREKACFKSDVTRMTDELDKARMRISRARRYADFALTMEVQLPDSCSMPTSEPMALSFGEPVPATTSLDEVSPPRHVSNASPTTKGSEPASKVTVRSPPKRRH